MVDISQVTGCLMGGAIGDALGLPIRYDSFDQIVATYGVNGLNTLVLNENGVAEISAVTQMTLFTCEGVIWADIIKKRIGYSDIVSRCFYSYERWLHTQEYPLADERYYWILQDERMDLGSPLLKTKELYHRRGPSNTCLQALLQAKNQEFGRIEQPINQSKGCGGLMRTAPIGLSFSKSPKKAFEAGCKVAAITNTHPTGYYTAGALSAIISYLVNGVSIQKAAKETLAILKYCSASEETIDAIKAALKSAGEEPKSSARKKELGEGFVADEALAIALYSAISYEEEYEEAIKFSINHNGNSNVTGALCGTLIGTKVGIHRINKEWQTQIECSDVIMDMSSRLHKIIN
ncbi:MAG: ADP-ribosylglycohydrolase family protein [bacterium]|nr:ADP-ribosylglycohydrolase family protein [bacterium]